MRKLYKYAITVIFASFLTSAAYAEYAIGVTASMASIDTSGSETQKDTSTISRKSIEEDVVIPELFIEHKGDNGITLGLSYIPVQEMGSQSRTEAVATPDASTDDSGTNKAAAEVSEHLMVYLDLPLGDNFYVKTGVNVAQIETKESLTTGSKYGDEDVLGGTIGLGYRSDYDGFFYKLEGTYTDFQDVSLVSSVADTATGNKNRITAETEVKALKFSLGYAF